MAYRVGVFGHDSGNIIRDAAMYYFQPVSPLGSLTLGGVVVRIKALPMGLLKMAVQVHRPFGCTNKYARIAFSRVLLVCSSSGQANSNLCLVDLL